MTDDGIRTLPLPYLQQTGSPHPADVRKAANVVLFICDGSLEDALAYARKLALSMEDSKFALAVVDDLGRRQGEHHKHQ